MHQLCAYHCCSSTISFHQQRQRNGDKKSALSWSHSKHRSFLFNDKIRRYRNASLQQRRAVADSHALWFLLNWCDSNQIFLHPTLDMFFDPTEFRDLKFRTLWSVRANSLLIAIPEAACIGYKDFYNDPHNPICQMSEEADSAQSKKRQESEQSKKRGEEATEEDMVDFFFTCLGMLVNDLLLNLNNSTSAANYPLALCLNRVRTLRNAPYLIDSGLGGEQQVPSTAQEGGEESNINGLRVCDVLLQMLHNYIQAGPLTNKVSRDELCWAISTSLSHSTPLALGKKRSIGFLPLLYLFPHGGAATNSVVVSSDDGEAKAEVLREYFEAVTGWSVAGERKTESTPSPNLVFVVPTRDLTAGSVVALQAMSPMCSPETESKQMWKLTCGSAPSDSLDTETAALMQRRTTKELVTRLKAHRSKC